MVHHGRVGPPVEHRLHRRPLSEPLRPLVRLSVGLPKHPLSEAASRATKGRRSTPLTPPAGLAQPANNGSSFGASPRLTRNLDPPRKPAPISGNPALCF